MELDRALELLRGGPEGVAKWNAWLASSDGVAPAFDRADLKDQNLQAAEFQEVRLFRVDFDRSNLEGALFRHANCAEASFAEASLKTANLTDAKLFRANLTETDFAGAALVNVYLGEADLTQTNLGGADLTGVTGLRMFQIKQAVVDENTILPECLKHQFDDLDDARRDRLSPLLRSMLEKL